MELKSTFTVKVSSSYIPDGLRLLTESLEKHEFLSISEPSLKELLATESPSFSLTAAKIHCRIAVFVIGTCEQHRESTASGLSIAHSSSVSN